MAKVALQAALVLVASLASGSPAAGQTWRLGPDHFSLRHPVYDAIQIWDTGSIPPLRFHATPDMTGEPVMVLDDSGLTVEGQLRCRWLGVGDERLLGVVADSDGGYRSDPLCGPDLPVSGKITDAGFGTPAAFILVSGWRRSLFEVPFGDRTLFLDARQLPGDPFPNDDERPPITGPRTGTNGWNWLTSQRAADRKEGALLEKRLTDPGFAAFYHGLRRCLMGLQPDCLTAFLDEEFEFEPWWTDPRAVGRADFARFAWQTEAWQKVAWVFLRGRYSDSGGDEVAFSREFIVCDVLRRDGRYFVRRCFASE